ncbi:hypothetical protein JY216_002308 [Salmonella enterica subsp. enterica serovar Chomedey]|nr:hypothetical protein [Salmonella enterica subsp. enterica serovar Chomedey]HCL4890632.1 hypothetical protein [Salmonella enterica]
MALPEIGEIGISDSREGGADYLLRPSFEAMSRLGSPDEIVQTFAILHGSEAAELIAKLGGNIPLWMTPTLHRIYESVLTSAMHVLQACCDDDLTPLIGEWKGWRRYIVYRPGQMPKHDIIILAQHLLQHGVYGKAKVRKLQRHETNETTAEFRVVDYIVAAQTHFGMSAADAAQLTMTKFQMLLAAKYPDQKGFTKEEYDAVADDFIKRQEARRARAKKKH